MKTIQIRLAHNHEHAGQQYQQGEVLQVPAETAQYMQEQGIGVPEKPVKSKEKQHGNE